MKKIIATAAFVAAAAAVTAQTVTSANIVGYNKATTEAGFLIKANQFSTTNQTPEGVFGSSLPVGSKIYTFDGSAYSISTYTAGFFGAPDYWNNALDLGQGVGFWVETAGVEEPIVSGEVYMDDSVTNSIAVGFQLISYPYPVERTVKTLGFTPEIGDKVYKFSGGSYQISTYTAGFFGAPDDWNNDFILEVGEGFWYEAVAATNWVVNRPF